MTLLLGFDEEYGVITREIPNVKGEIERKFSNSKTWFQDLGARRSKTVARSQKVSGSKIDLLNPKYRMNVEWGFHVYKCGRQKDCKKKIPKMEKIP